MFAFEKLQGVLMTINVEFRNTRRPPFILRYFIL